MVDDDIKKLLSELNMSHLVEELEKIPNMAPIQVMKPGRKLNKEIVFDEVHEGQDSEKEEQMLRSQVQAVNKILTGKRRRLKWMAFSSIVALSLFLYVNKSFISEQIAEVNQQDRVADVPPTPLLPPVQVAESPQNEGLQTAKVPTSNQKVEQTKELLSELFQERTQSLQRVGAEIHAFITIHAEKKEPFFASKLSALIANYQAIDEEYNLKIESELNLQNGK